MLNQFHQQPKQEEEHEAELDELLQSGGEDVDIEFFVQGQSLSTSMTIYEVLRAAKNQQKTNTNKAHSYYSKGSGLFGEGEQ